MAESFFATLKAELVYRRAWPTRHHLEMEMEVFSYIEGFYNPRRRHSRLDNLSAADFEKVLTQQRTQNEASACRGSLHSTDTASRPAVDDDGVDGVPPQRGLSPTSVAQQVRLQAAAQPLGLEWLGAGLG
jgi:hypothetical protein